MLVTGEHGRGADVDDDGILDVIFDDVLDELGENEVVGER